MTPDNKKQMEEKKQQYLEEICENTRAIRRVANRILDQLHEIYPPQEEEEEGNWDPDTMTWDDLEDLDDMYS